MNGRDRIRKIIHIDMDAFFASVEQRDNPDLRGKPVVVGGASARGVVAAASYEARKFGVRSAMPSVTAKRRCPGLIFVPPRFDAYREVSRQIRAIFAEYTPHVEPLSLDEAYLDVSEDLKGIGSATLIAEEIRARIYKTTLLTASAGVSYNKFLAKLASDQNKPNGICVITPSQGPAFVAALPVRRFHGVGPRTAEKMARLGIETGADLRAQTRQFLAQHFGASGDYFYNLARGICHRKVCSDQPYKSVSVEDTFAEDLTDEMALARELAQLCAVLWRRTDEKKLRGRTVNLKVKFQDFQTITRAKSLPRPIASQNELEAIGMALLKGLMPVSKGVRLLGIGLSNLFEEGAERTVELELPLPLGIG